jgi:hypothetical protein
VQAVLEEDVSGESGLHDVFLRYSRDGLVAVEAWRERLLRPTHRDETAMDGAPGTFVESMAGRAFTSHPSR